MEKTTTTGLRKNFAELISAELSDSDILKQKLRRCIEEHLTDVCYTNVQGNVDNKIQEDVYNFMPIEFIDYLNDWLSKTEYGWIYISDVTRTFKAMYKITPSGRRVKKLLSSHGFAFKIAGSKRKNAVYSPKIRLKEPIKKKKEESSSWVYEPYESE